MDLSTISGLLAALVFPVFAINYIVQNYLDKQEAWNNLKPWVQSLVELVASLVIGVGAYAALHNIPSTALDQLQPLYGVIYAIISAWLGGQIGHQVFIRGELRAQRLKHDGKTLTTNKLLPNG